MNEHTKHLPYVSPNQIDLAFDPTNGCLSKWYERYLDGDPDEKSETSDALAFGSMFHDRAEHFINTGEVDLFPEAFHSYCKMIEDAWKAHGLKLSDIRAELPISLRSIESKLRRNPEKADAVRGISPICEYTLEDIPVEGWIDVYHPLGIEDHKAVASLSGYPKEDLIAKTPMAIYADAWFQANPGKSRVLVAYNFYLKAGKRRKKATIDRREAFFTREQVAKRIEVAKQRVRRMKSLAGAHVAWTEVNNEKRGKNACFSFGKPCPLKEKGCIPKNRYGWLA